MALPFLFNEKWYLDHNPDVARAVEQGLFSAQDHFQLYGQNEGRAPGPLFDPDLYLAQNPDVAAAVQRGETSAYEHFVNWGIDEERAPIALFDLDFYLLQNPDVAAAVQAGQAGAVRHFLTYGQGEPRFINPFIDLGAYLRANGDVAGAAQRGDMSALEHLMLYGVHEGRDLGNGVTLDIFKNDAAFNQALAAGDADAALQRMAAVAPFLPGFQPPANWAPAPDTPIVTDFTPPAGMKLVVPDGVIVPEGMVLPEVYEKPVVPDDGGVPPTFTVHVASDGLPNIVTFGGSATGNIVLTIDDDGFGSFSRGGVTADVTVPMVLNTQIQGSAATETLRLATALTGSQRLDFDGVGGGDKLVLADGGNALQLAVDNVAEVKGGSGHDELRLINQANGIVIDGGAGEDKVSFAYHYNGAANTATLKGVEVADSSTAWQSRITLLDTLTAFRFDGASGDTLTLADGGNPGIALTLTDIREVDGGSGDDVITLVNQASGLIIDGKEGNDHLKLMTHHNGAYTVTVRSIERVDGDGADDSITLDTPMSHFAFHGGSGYDTLNLSASVGTIELELSGIEMVNGSSNDDQITIVAGHGSTTSIEAGDGNDTVTGSALHVESITLGDGNDIVVLNSLSHADQLTDFKISDADKLHLSLSVFDGLIAQGALSPVAFLATSGGGAAATGLHRIIYHTDTGDLYYDPDGSGLSGQVLIAQLSSKPGLNYTDFLVIA